jgi:hypothetical protein
MKSVNQSEVIMAKIGSFEEKNLTENSVSKRVRVLLPIKVKTEYGDEKEIPKDTICEFLSRASDGSYHVEHKDFGQFFVPKTSASLS